jgi:hypothetical protein
MQSKFIWEQDSINHCCWSLSYGTDYFGAICVNGCGAVDGNPIHLYGDLDQRKREFEKFCRMEMKVRRYREKLLEKEK